MQLFSIIVDRLATSHKLARLIYSMLKYSSEFVDAGQQEYEERYRSRVVHNLTRRAQEMGFKLVLIDPEAQTS